MVSKPKSNKKGKGRGHLGGRRFVMFDYELFTSPIYHSLSYPSKVVLFNLAMQYNGRNNGNLSAPKSKLKEWGIGSNKTLFKALKELEQRQFIIKTRQGLFIHSKDKSCTLYALTWLPIDETDNVELDIKPTHVGYLSYREIIGQEVKKE